MKKILTDLQITRIVEIVKNSEMPLLAGEITKKYYAKYILNEETHTNDEALKIKKTILKNFTNNLNLKLKKHNVFRKRKSAGNHYLYFYMGKLNVS
jgi:hypothetical protein